MPKFDHLNEQEYLEVLERCKQLMQDMIDEPQPTSSTDVDIINIRVACVCLFVAGRSDPLFALGHAREHGGLDINNDPALRKICSDTLAMLDPKGVA